MTHTHTHQIYPKGCVLFSEQKCVAFDLETAVANGNGRNCSSINPDVTERRMWLFTDAAALVLVHRHESQLLG